MVERGDDAEFIWVCVCAIDCSECVCAMEESRMEIEHSRKEAGKDG